MQHIVISGKIFLVDTGYLDEPLDTSYPVYDLENDVPVMNVEAATLQKIATPVKGCYAKTFATEIERSLHTAIGKIDIRPILRLMVNNDRYIHYICSPVLVSDLIGREGGQYLSCQLDTDGNATFFAGNTMLDLLGCERHNIPAVNNGMVKLVKDAYFQEALDLLTAMATQNDPTEPAVLVSKWKDPSLLPTPEPEHTGRHCQWCAELGLSGTHSLTDAGL